MKKQIKKMEDIYNGKEFFGKNEKWKDAMMDLIVYRFWRDKILKGKFIR